MIFKIGQISINVNVAALYTDKEFITVVTPVGGVDIRLDIVVRNGDSPIAIANLIVYKRPGDNA